MKHLSITRLCRTFFVIAALLASSNAMAEKLTWPDMTLISIQTKDGKLPTFDVIYPPEGGLGIGITNNEYVESRMVISLKGDILYDSGDYVKGESGVRLRVRGNTSARLEQTPYKVKLSKKADLLMRDDSKFKSKDWALLSTCQWNVAMEQQYSNLLTIAGLELSKAMGMPWTPSATLANVVINGEYRGVYILIESVEVEEGRVDIEDSGFLVENDAYWWNEDGAYFKTEHQNPALGWTFKYPDSDDLNDSIKQTIKKHIDNFENALYGNKDIEQYIDMESWARWVLSHDILGSDDVAGSNTYLAKRSHDPKNPTDTKLEMGPLWDFDSMFRIPDNSWGGQHISDVYYYPELFKRKEFVEAYKELYNKLKPTLHDDLMGRLDSLETAYQPAIEESFKMSQEIFYEGKPKTFKRQMDEIREKFKKRLEAIERFMPGLDISEGIEDINVGTNGTPVPVAAYSPSGCKVAINGGIASLKHGIYIIRYSDGSTKKVVR